MARFRTSARTVDMLGRQQIAGIPTAISELFKNAHDAYATRVEADYYRPDQLLVLRDDGFGMTLEDVMQRWLVLGTDSKLSGSDELATVASTMDMQSRTPTGEKGIGRLAIAAIGPQVLLVTRARRSDGLHPTVASFANWSLFALPGISLDEIEIPVREFPDGELPTEDDLASLVDTVRENLKDIRGRVNRSAIADIERELDQFSFDVSALQARFRTAALGGSATGTHFYIQPTDAMLEVALDAKPEQRRIGDLQRTLMGFTNTMMPGRGEPPILTAFRDHRGLDLNESVIGPEEFFTPDEFEAADHHIRGVFDEYGQFEGTVSVYGSEPEPHIIAWPEARGRHTDCGPFEIDFAYVQGAARESRVPREQWGRLIAKLNMMGGLYIYRNGIRILPYGNTDHDFLGLEERRNLSAGYYFFSYRRMFGAIDLPEDTSRRLVEKAGREGFRDNRAYRQFRAILENFFVQMAADYFRDDALSGAQYKEAKAELEGLARLRERQARQSRARRRELVARLSDLGTRLSENEPRTRAEATVERLAAELEGAALLPDPDSRSQAFLRAEISAREALTALRDDFRVPQPRGVGLSRELRRDLSAYRAEHALLEKDVFRPAFEGIEGVMSDATRRLGVDVDLRRRFDTSAAAAQQAAKSSVAARGRDSRQLLKDTRDRVSAAIQDALADLESALSEIAQRVQRTDLTTLSEAEIVELRLGIDSEIEAVASEKGAVLDAISQQLIGIAVAPDDSGQLVTQSDVAGAMEEEILALQARAEADLERTQLGMAIKVIDHEFQATIRSIRSNLRRLRAWADVNEQLSDVYDGIRVNFEHLDSYLTLFTPLDRRLHPTETEIKGSDINKFLRNLFGERLVRHEVELQTTQAFLRHRFKGYPSTFYPVFVNLVDNALYWLQDRPSPRTIRLDCEEQAMVVADNGPGIPPQDREAIFEMGFTRKPGGQGLGLYISRDVLDKVGYDLVVDETGDGEWTQFIVRPKATDA